MENALLLIAAIAGFGIVSVVLPALLEAYYRYRKAVVVTCPETGGPAELLLDSRRAALGAAFGRQTLHVAACSLWPRKESCHDECLRPDHLKTPASQR